MCFATLKNWVPVCLKPNNGYCDVALNSSMKTNECLIPVVLNLFTCWHPFCITNQFSEPHLESQKIDEDQKKKGHHVRRGPIFHAKSSEDQKYGHHVRRGIIFHAKSREDQKIWSSRPQRSNFSRKIKGRPKNMVITSAEVQFFARNQAKTKNMVVTSTEVQFFTRNQGKIKKYDHHVRRGPIFHAKSSEDQKL